MPHLGGVRISLASSIRAPSRWAHFTVRRWPSADPRVDLRRHSFAIEGNRTGGAAADSRGVMPQVALRNPYSVCRRRSGCWQEIRPVFPGSARRGVADE